MQYDEPETISESLFPMYGETFWWNFAAMEFLGVGASSPFILAVTDLSLFPSIVGFIAVALILAPIIFVITFISSRRRHRKGGSVTFHDGLLSVHHHFGGNHCFCSEKLSECRWFRGSRSWATVPWNTDPFGSWFTGRSLLIEFPARCRTEPRYKTDKKGNKTVKYPAGPIIVAVGHAPETEQQWESLLFQLGIRHDEQREAQAPPMTDECVLTAIAATFACCLAVSYGFAKLLRDALLRWQVPMDVADGVLICIIVSGIALPMFTLMAFVYLRRRDQDVKTTGQFLASTREVVGWFFGMTLLTMLVFWLNPEIADQAKMVSTIILCPIMLVAALIFGMVAAGKPEKKSADEFLHAPKEDTTVDDFSKYSGHFDNSSYETKS